MLYLNKFENKVNLFYITDPKNITNDRCTTLYIIATSFLRVTRHSILTLVSIIFDFNNETK